MRQLQVFELPALTRLVRADIHPLQEIRAHRGCGVKAEQVMEHLNGDVVAAVCGRVKRDLFSDTKRPSEQVKETY